MSKYISMISLIAMFLSGCGSSESTDSNQQSTVQLLDSGYWGSAFTTTEPTDSGIYNATSSSGLYQLSASCNHNGTYDGNFYAYSDYTAKVIKNDGTVQNCVIEKIYERITPENASDINATKVYSTYSRAIWYDSDTKMFYETEGYSYDGILTGITSGGFLAIIYDDADGGSQTIELKKQFHWFY